MFRLFMASVFCVILTACVRPPLPEAVTTPTPKKELLKQVSERLLWLAPEEDWHSNCLFGKPIAQLSADELRLARPTAELLFRAHFEEKRLAYRYAGALYRQAADQGAAYAHVKLGNILLAGNGVTPNPQGGAKLVQQSAQLDCALGQYRYGELLTQGKGVKTNLVEAWSWLELARRQGYEESKKLQGRIQPYLNAPAMALARQKHQELRGQLDRFNYTAKAQELIQCVTPRDRKPFITRMRTCHAMGGTHFGDVIDYRQNR